MPVGGGPLLGVIFCTVAALIFQLFQRELERGRCCMLAGWQAGWHVDTDTRRRLDC